MKNIILIHGINGIPKIYTWLKSELCKTNIDVVMPVFPPQEGVIYEDWAKILDEYKNSIHDDSIVVCHSIGNEFFIRYLAERRLAVDTFISLAGFADVFYNEGKDTLNHVVEQFLVSDENLKNLVASTNNRYAIYGDDDHIIPQDVLAGFAEKISAQPIKLHGIGHMGNHSGLDEFPELLELVQKNL